MFQKNNFHHNTGDGNSFFTLNATNANNLNKKILLCLEGTVIYRVSQEECARLRESVPYVKEYRYNPKHLYPKFRDNGLRKVQSSCGSTYCTCSADMLRVHCTCP